MAAQLVALPSMTNRTWPAIIWPVPLEISLAFTVASRPALALIVAPSALASQHVSIRGTSPTMSLNVMRQVLAPKVVVAYLDATGQLTARLSSP